MAQSFVGSFRDSKLNMIDLRSSDCDLLINILQRE